MEKSTQPDNFLYTKSTSQEPDMNCKVCKQSVNILAKTCPYCGASLSVLDAGPTDLFQKNSLQDRTNSLIDQELDASLAEEFGPDSGRGQTFGVRLGALDLPARSFLATGGPVMLQTRREEMEQIAAFVITSPHVQANSAYKDRAERTNFFFAAEDDSVNAFATDCRHPRIDLDPPMIVVMGGLANSTRLIALALAQDQVQRNPESRSLLISVIRAIGSCINERQGRLGMEFTETIYTRTGLGLFCDNQEVQRCARSYAAAMNMSVVAHELGHIVLGHTLGATLSLEASRNQEREADSFAATIADTSPFSDYTVAGGIFWWVLLTWREEVRDPVSVTTHPHSRERLMDYIRANRSQAAALGMDEQIINDFLP